MAKAALGAKAEELVIIDLRKISNSFDFFVLASATSDRRLKTVADEMEESLEGRGVRSGHLEGTPEGGWVLLDYGSVVAHLFSPDVRRFYQLERLWADAPHLPLPKNSR